MILMIQWVLNIVAELSVLLCVVDRVSMFSFQKLMMLVLIVLSFNDIYGSNMKI